MQVPMGLDSAELTLKYLVLIIIDDITIINELLRSITAVYILL